MGPVTYAEQPGLADAIRAAGHVLVLTDGVMLASNPAAVQAIIDGYSPLAFLKAAKLATLKANVSARADMFGLMDSGSSTTVTSAQFSAFWASAINNYRTLKASIQNAPDVANLNAINLGTGWPANP